MPHVPITSHGILRQERHTSCAITRNRVRHRWLHSLQSLNNVHVRMVRQAPGACLWNGVGRVRYFRDSIPTRSRKTPGPPWISDNLENLLCSSLCTRSPIPVLPQTKTTDFQRDCPPPLQLQVLAEPGVHHLPVLECA